jgi:hypothetical protein
MRAAFTDIWDESLRAHVAGHSRFFRTGLLHDSLPKHVEV